MSRRTNRRRGATLVEIVIVTSLFVTVLLASLGMIESGRRFSASTLEITHVEELTQQMLFSIEHELANASGFEATAILTEAFTADDAAALTVDSTLGFPPSGFLLLDRGTSTEERIAYRALEPDQITFSELARGEQDTQAFDHADGGELLWCGLAEPLAEQVAPEPDDYDGIALEANGPLYFRGDGTGFSYRIPVDPSGGTNYLVEDELNWGAVVRGLGPTLDGRLALAYVPSSSYAEADRGDDLNGDGDVADVFDVGQIRRWAWDVTNPAGASEQIGLGPSAVLQERGNWGGDLDADGFADPLFLWNKDTNELHLRVFALGRTNDDFPVVRKVESVLFLRNEPEVF
jgi:hypothetical protein